MPHARGLRAVPGPAPEAQVVQLRLELRDFDLQQVPEGGDGQSCVAQKSAASTAVAEVESLARGQRIHSFVEVLQTVY